MKKSDYYKHMAITVRKISKRIKEQIIERDGACIIC